MAPRKEQQQQQDTQWRFITKRLGSKDKHPNINSQRFGRGLEFLFLFLLFLLLEPPQRNNSFILTIRLRGHSLVTLHYNQGTTLLHVTAFGGFAVTAIDA